MPVSARQATSTTSAMIMKQGTQPGGPRIQRALAVGAAVLAIQIGSVVPVPSALAEELPPGERGEGGGDVWVSSGMDAHILQQGLEIDPCH